jgi:hypothetical protein
MEAGGKITARMPRGGPISLTPGVLDNDAQYAFSGGHCHSLACAVARRLGLNVVVIGRDNAQTRVGGPFEAMHVLVEIPGSGWGDVRGVHSDTEAFTARFRREVPYRVPASAIIMSPEDLPQVLAASPHAWSAEDPLLAASFVEPVLDRWGLGHEIAAPGTGGPVTPSL